MTPRQSVRAECERRGLDAVVAGCIGILEGQDADDQLLLALAGPAAEYVLAGGEGGRGGYWPRVWAARGLLHAWADVAAPAIIRATADESWRVREMAAKVIAKHHLGDALQAVAALADDPVPRVRSAASRAVMMLSASGA
ncbi:MAG TPA: HEAT repeat domain-containing protein [Streptosporangiaceae bacterium]